jgi:hypothetical protein
LVPGYRLGRGRARGTAPAEAGMMRDARFLRPFSRSWENPAPALDTPHILGSSFFSGTTPRGSAHGPHPLGWALSVSFNRVSDPSPPHPIHSPGPPS